MNDETNFNVNQAIPPIIQSSSDSTNNSVGLSNPSVVVAEYDSNPFVAISKGLGDILRINSVPMFLVQIIVTAATALTFVLSGILMFALTLAGISSLITSVLAVIVAVVANLVLSLQVTASVAVYNASCQTSKISTMSALKAYSFKKIILLWLTTLLAGLLIFIGLLLLIVPGLIFMARFSLLPFVVLEEGLSGIAAIKRSWSLTKKHTIEMWGLYTSQAIIGTGGLLAMPVVIGGLGHRYSQLKRVEEQNTSTGRMHYINWLMPLSAILISIIIGVTSSMLQSYLVRQYQSQLDTGITNELKIYNDGLYKDSSKADTLVPNIWNNKAIENSAGSLDSYCYLTSDYKYTCAKSLAECQRIPQCAITFEEQ